LCLYNSIKSNYFSYKTSWFLFLTDKLLKSKQYTIPTIHNGLHIGFNTYKYVNIIYQEKFGSVRMAINYDESKKMLSPNTLWKIIN